MSIGFGVWLGYPVPYPYGWASYAAPVYGYYGGSVQIVTGATSYGGISFAVSPSWAAVYLDGEYIGTVADFSPDAQPLTVIPGSHRIQIDAEGYRPMVWDVHVIAGRVIPFQGALQPY